MLRIANVSFVGRYGLADYTLSLGRALARHCTSTIITSKDFDYPDVPFNGQVIRHFRRSRHYPLDLLRFVGLIRRLRPDVLVFQAPLKVAFIDGCVARLLRLLGVRVAVTVHDVAPHYPKLWSIAEYGFFYRSFDRLIAHSADAEARLRDMGVRAPVLVVPHGEYDIYRLSSINKAQARAKVGGLSDSDFVLLYFGKVGERKGIAELASFMLESEQARGVRVILAGIDGVPSYAGSVRKQLDALLVHQSCIARLGHVPFTSVEVYFNACDAVVLPYLEGTTSGVLKLAMAFRRPVIATDIGDIPETVQPGAGILISHRNVRAQLGGAVQQMRDAYPDFLRACSQVSDRYSWSRIGQQYYDFLSDGLDDGRESTD